MKLSDRIKELEREHETIVNTKWEMNYKNISLAV